MKFREESRTKKSTMYFGIVLQLCEHVPNTRWRHCLSLKSYFMEEESEELLRSTTAAVFMTVRTFADNRSQSFIS
ncbi:hypothetical protein C0J52_26519 [Blattella germanica]|nr:hypothetical protein C0J52_26519 [Blattella germanica]